MIKMFISSLLIIFSFMMMFLKHPLSMGFFILLQTVLICLLSGMMIKTYWFSYILFLTFLGGLLVLFIYVSSVASNEKFNLNFNMMLLFIIMILIMNFWHFTLLNNNLNWLNLMNNFMENESIMEMKMYNNESLTNLNKLYNNHNFLMTTMLMIYLFITLIAVVKITNIFYGPLRSS